MFMLKDWLMDTSDMYFNQAKEWVTFLHPEIDLSQFDIFKVINDIQLVEEEEISHPEKPNVSHEESPQTELEGDKVMMQEILDLCAYMYEAVLSMADCKKIAARQKSAIRI